MARSAVVVLWGQLFNDQRLEFSRTEVFKSILPLNSFTTYGAPRITAYEELKVRTMHHSCVWNE